LHRGRVAKKKKEEEKGRKSGTFGTIKMGKREPSSGGSRAGKSQERNEKKTRGKRTEGSSLSKRAHRKKEGWRGEGGLGSPRGWGKGKRLVEVMRDP